MQHVIAELPTARMQEEEPSGEQLACVMLSRAKKRERKMARPVDLKLSLNAIQTPTGVRFRVAKKFT